MFLHEFFQSARQKLAQAGIESARLDVLVLLEDTLGIGRASLLAHPELKIPAAQLRKLNNYIIQRSKHIPLAYIRGRAPFFGRSFIVNNQVLVPRPETESIIELLKTTHFDQPPIIADLGCGSGCIGITAALEIPGSIIHFYDIDRDALAITKNNARLHKVLGQYHISNLLDSWHTDYNVVLANLPYVPEGYPINKAAGFEPRLALFSGQDGLDHYRLMWQQIAKRSFKPTHVIVEALPEQHPDLQSLAKTAGYQLHNAQGYAQHYTKISSQA